MNSGQPSGRRVVAVALGLVFLGGAAIGAAASARGGSAAPRTPASHDAPGPRAMESGVPVGYARSEVGASAAATQYLATAAELVQRPPTDRGPALRRMAASSAADTIVADVEDALEPVDEVLDRAGPGGGRALVRSLPVAYRVMEFSPTRAKVIVWGATVFLLEGVSAPEESWGTSEVDLVWQDGDWRIAKWSSFDGPTPASRADGPSPEEDFLTVLEDLEPYAHVPAA